MTTIPRTKHLQEAAGLRSMWSPRIPRRTFAASPAGAWSRSCAGALVLCVAAVSSTSARQQVPAQGSAGVALSQVRAATVSIEAQAGNWASTGSGFILSESGLVVTNAHVIRGAQHVKVRLATGEEFIALGSVDYDPRLDIALLLIPGFGLTPPRMGNSDSIQVGQRLLAVGAPLGLEATVSDGLLSAVRIEDGVKLLQISIPVSRGSSGGPVATEDGQVVGMVVSGIRGEGAENLNFAIPINYVRGKLPGVQGRQPTPFTELSYSDGAASMSFGPGTSEATPRVNADLGVDFTILDGVSLYQESRGEGGFRFRTTTAYAMSREPSGTAYLERELRSSVRDQAVLASTPLGEGTLRTSFFLGDEDRWATAFSFRPSSAGGTAVDWQTLQNGSRIRFQNSSGQSEYGVSPGLFPSEFDQAVIAALPDSLPAETRFWVLDAANRRSQEIILRVIRPERRRIPVPRRGVSCDRDVVTVLRDVPVLRVQIRKGTDTQEVAILAARPHITIDEDVRCVYVPGLSPQR